LKHHFKSVTVKAGALNHDSTVSVSHFYYNHNEEHLGVAGLIILFLRVGKPVEFNGI